MSIEKSIDAASGESLGLRARSRKADLEKALHDMPAHDRRGRNDLEIALSAVNTMLAADLDHLSHAQAFQISRWLQNTKHLAQTAPSSTPTTVNQK